MKKVLTFLMLLCMVCTGAWAEDSFTWKNSSTAITAESWAVADNWTLSGNTTFPTGGPAITGDHAWDKMYFTNASGTTPNLEGWAFKIELDNSNITVANVKKLQGGANIVLKNGSELTLKKHVLDISGNDGGPVSVDLSTGDNNVFNLIMGNDKDGELTTVNYGTVTTTTNRRFNVSSNNTTQRNYNLLKVVATITDAVSSTTEPTLHSVVLGTLTNVTISGSLTSDITATGYTQSESVLTATQENVGLYSVVNNNGELTLYWVTGTQEQNDVTVNGGESKSITGITSESGVPTTITVKSGATLDINSEYSLSKITAEDGATLIISSSTADISAITGNVNVVINVNEYSFVNSKRTQATGKLTINSGKMLKVGSDQTHTGSVSSFTSLLIQGTLWYKNKSDVLHDVTLDGGTIHSEDMDGAGGSASGFTFSNALVLEGTTTITNQAFFTSRWNAQYDIKKLAGDGTLKLRGNGNSSEASVETAYFAIRDVEEFTGKFDILNTQAIIQSLSNISITNGVKANNATLNNVTIEGAERINTAGNVTINGVVSNNLTNSRSGYAFVGAGTLNLGGTMDLTKNGTNTHNKVGYGAGANVILLEGAEVITNGIYNSTTITSNANITIQAGAKLKTKEYTRTPNLTNNGSISLVDLTTRYQATTVSGDAFNVEVSADLLNNMSSLSCTVVTGVTTTFNPTNLTINGQAAYVANGKSYTLVKDGNNINIVAEEASLPEGDEAIIYNPALQKYVTHTLASTSNVANAATFIKVDCGENATYSDQQYPKFKLYVAGKGWVNSTNLTEGANKFSFSATDACEFIYVGNDIIPVAVIGTNATNHGQLSWNWHGGASDSNVMGLYGQGDGNSNWAFCKHYTVASTGLQNSEVGGICYLRTNYDDGSVVLPAPLDESALIAKHVSGYNGAFSVNNETKTITVTYDQTYTETSVLWPGNGANTNLPAARIPAIVKANNGDLLAFTDWRYSRDDIGRNGHLDIEMRRSSNNGQTWSPIQIVADGTGVAGANDCAYGDAAVVADHETGDVLLMCAAGSVRSSDSNRSNPTRVARFISHDNGQTWSGPEDLTDQFYGLITDGNAMFNTSGKLLQSKVIKKDGASHYRIYSPIAVLGSNNRVFYSDDFGVNWHVLGDAVAQNSNDECRVSELPNGDILLETRISGGRRVNLFTYTDQQNATGTWGTQGQNTGTPATACNGDIDIITAYERGTNDAVTLILESAARQGSPRSHVQYYYRALKKTSGFTLSDFTSGWVAGYEVNAGKSAYSSIVCLEAEGKEAILFEDAENEEVTGYDNNPWGYDIKFETHTLSQITNGAYTAQPTEPFTINYTLTDVNGQTYQGSCYGEEGTAPTFTGAYGYTLTNEQWGTVENHSVTYTATINFPFNVSSNGVNNWVNLKYLPNYARYMSYDGTNAKMAQQYRESGKSEGTENISKTNWIWSLTPVLEANNTFGFKIYSKGANKYVTASNIAHQAEVTLAAENEAATFQLLAPVTTSFNDNTLNNTAKGVLAKEVNGTTFCINIVGAASSSYATFWSGGNHAGKNLDIVAVVPDAYTITYNISYNGKVIGTQTVEIARGEMPTGITAPDYITVGEYTPALTACAEDATYSVATSPTVGVFPFWGENVYSLRLRQSPMPFAVYVDPIDQTSVKSVIRNNNNVYYTQPNRENYQYYNWQFAGDWLNGYTIKNQATSKYISYGEAGVNNTNNTNASLVAEPGEGAYFDLEHNNNSWFFKVHGSTSNYMSNYTDANRTLATYNVQNYNYDRSKVLIGSPETNVLDAESATALQNEISNVMTEIWRDQVGYPYFEDDAPQDIKDKINALFEYASNTQISNENYDAAYAALKEVSKVTKVYMPELKGSYRVAFLLPNGTKKYISKQSVSGKVTENESEAAVFTLGKSSEMTGGPGTQFKYILVDEDARFLSTAGNNTGVKAEYGQGCGFALVKAAQYETQSSYNRYTIQQHLACFSLVMADLTSGNGGGWRPVYLTADGNITSDSNCWGNGVPEGATTAIVLETVTNENNLKLTRPTTNVTDNTGLNGKFVGTFSSPFNVQLPAGVVAYTARAVDGSVTFNRLGSIVPKNTGVLVYAGDAGQTINEGAEPTHESVEELQEMVEDSDNALVGTNGSAVQVPADVNAFILSKDQEKGVMFYALNTDESKRTIARNKAYLVVSQGQSVGAFKFDFEDVVTAIEQLNAEQTNGITFDLSGRSVKARQRGLYIVGGKKVIR